MARSVRPPPAGQGFTLLELIIVLAVIVALVALSFPAMRRPLARSELRDAARHLRAELSAARLEAMRTGRTHVVRYQPGTDRFEVVPAETAGGVDTSSDSLRELVSASAEIGRVGSDVATDDTRRTLPHDVSFCDPQYDGPPTELTASDVDLVTARAPWSAPIVFYPSGRATNARIRLNGRPDYYVDVTLRGLTGSVQISKPHRWQQEDAL